VSTTKTRVGVVGNFVIAFRSENLVKLFAHLPETAEAIDSYEVDYLRISFTSLKCLASLFEAMTGNINCLHNVQCTLKTMVHTQLRLWKRF
jgi:hypothetical protein